MSTTIGPETIALVKAAKAATKALENHLRDAWQDAQSYDDPADGVGMLYFHALDANNALFLLMTEMIRQESTPAPTVDW